MRLAFDIKDQFLLDSGSSGSPTKIIANSAYQSGRVFEIIAVIVKNIYILTGIILFFFIVIGGLGMILNSGNPEKQKEGSKTVTSAVMGYLIMFAAYWLIKIIEIIFGISILSL